jgi:7-cyano-7-deazaguanine synthase
VKAVILLSGGLDSATVLAIAKSEGRDCLALSIVYGQRHQVELEAAKRVAAAIGVEEHVVYPLDLRTFGASALTSDIDVPKDAVGAPGIRSRTCRRATRSSCRSRSGTPRRGRRGKSGSA